MVILRKTLGENAYYVNMGVVNLLLGLRRVGSTICAHF